MTTNSGINQSGSTLTFDVCGEVPHIGYFANNLIENDLDTQLAFIDSLLITYNALSTTYTFPNPISTLDLSEQDVREAVEFAIDNNNHNIYIAEINIDPTTSTGDVYVSVVIVTPDPTVGPTALTVGAIGTNLTDNISGSPGTATIDYDNLTRVYVYNSSGVAISDRIYDQFGEEVVNVLLTPCTPKADIISEKDICLEFVANEWTDDGADYALDFSGQNLEGSMRNNIDVLNVEWSIPFFFSTGTNAATANGFEHTSNVGTFNPQGVSNHTITFDKPITGTVSLAIDGFLYDPDEMGWTIGNFSSGSAQFVGTNGNQTGEVFYADDGTVMSGSIFISGLVDVRELSYTIGFYGSPTRTQTEQIFSVGLINVSGQEYTVDWKQLTDCDGNVSYIDEDGERQSTIPTDYTVTPCAVNALPNVTDACLSTTIQSQTITFEYDPDFPTFGIVRIGNSSFTPPIEWTYNSANLRLWANFIMSKMGGVSHFFNISGNDTNLSTLRGTLTVFNTGSANFVSSYRYTIPGEFDSQDNNDTRNISVSTSSSSTEENMLQIMLLSGCSVVDVCYKTQEGQDITLSNRQSIEPCNLLQQLLDCMCCDIYSSSYTVTAMVGGMFL